MHFYASGCNFGVADLCVETGRIGSCWPPSRPRRDCVTSSELWPCACSSSLYVARAQALPSCHAASCAVSSAWYARLRPRMRDCARSMYARLCTYVYNYCAHDVRAAGQGSCSAHGIRCIRTYYAQCYKILSLQHFMQYLYIIMYYTIFFLFSFSSSSSSGRCTFINIRG